MKTFFAFLLLSCWLSSALSAQEGLKYERERSIAAHKVPEKARTFIGTTAIKGRWYKEWDLKRTSYELKGKCLGALCSIEFDSLGAVEDLERVVKFEKLPDAVQKNVHTYLQKLSKSYKIGKTEQQWMAADADIQKVLLEKNIEKPTGYEIIVKINQRGIYKAFEINFDASGNFEKSREIIQQNVDNMVY